MSAIAPLWQHSQLTHRSGVSYRTAVAAGTSYRTAVAAGASYRTTVAACVGYRTAVAACVGYRTAAPYSTTVPTYAVSEHWAHLNSTTHGAWYALLVYSTPQ